MFFIKSPKGSSEKYLQFQQMVFLLSIFVFLEIEEFAFPPPLLDENDLCFVFPWGERTVPFQFLPEPPRWTV